MQTRGRCDGLVVVIDDDDDTRELLREVLEGNGYSVATAEDGVVAMGVLEDAAEVCFVLLDLMMPRMDGHAVLAAMAAHPRLALMRVCISTSAPDRAPKGVPCLPKPLDMDQLLAVVDEHCRSARSGPA